VLEKNVISEQIKHRPQMVWPFIKHRLYFFQHLFFSSETPKNVTNFIGYPVHVNATRILVGNIGWRSRWLLQVLGPYRPLCLSGGMSIDPVIFTKIGFDFSCIMNICNSSGFLTELDDCSCGTKQLLIQLF